MNNKIMFLRKPKCAGTSIADILKSELRGHVVKRPEHDIPVDVPIYQLQIGVCFRRDVY